MELTTNQRKKIRFTSWTGAVLLTASLLVINYIFSFVPLRMDFSDGRAYSISRGTKDVLKKLDDRLIVRVVFSSNIPPEYKANEQYVRDLLLEYQRASNGKIKIEYDDPTSSPKARQMAQDAGVQPAQMDVVARDRREVKEVFMGIGFFYGTKKDSIPLIRDTQGLEYEITQRIKKLVQPGELKIAFVSTGDSLLPSNKLLEPVQQSFSQLFSVQTLDLEKDEIPADVKAVWVLGPEKTIEAPVLAKIKTYVEQGGTVGLFLDRRKANLDYFSSGEFKNGFDPLLKEWGLEFREGYIADPRCDRIQIRSQQGMFQMINIIDYYYFPFIVDLNRANPATKGVDSITTPFVSGFAVTDKKNGLTYTSLAKTSPASWLDAAPWTMNPIQQKQRQPGSLDGPFDVGLLVEGKFSAADPNAKTGRVILFGTSKFIRSDYPPKMSNYTLFLNLIEWSAQDEALLSIRSKGLAFRPIRETSFGLRLFLKYVMMLALPLLTILLGLFVWRREKTRRSLLPLKFTDL